MTDVFFKKTGYSDLAKKHGIELLNLNRSEIVRYKVQKPLAIEEFKIAKEVFSGYKIINIPVMKVHNATEITLAMKNLKGL